MHNLRDLIRPPELYHSQAQRKIFLQWRSFFCFEYLRNRGKELKRNVLQLELLSHTFFVINNTKIGLRVGGKSYLIFQSKKQKKTERERMYLSSRQIYGPDYVCTRDFSCMVSSLLQQVSHRWQRVPCFCD